MLPATATKILDCGVIRRGNIPLYRLNGNAQSAPRSIRTPSDHLVLPQSPDLRDAVSKIPQDAVSVLPQERGRRGRKAADILEVRREFHAAERAARRVLKLDDGLPFRLERLTHRADPPDGDVR